MKDLIKIINKYYHKFHCNNGLKYKNINSNLNINDKLLYQKHKIL